LVPQVATVFDSCAKSFNSDPIVLVRSGHFAADRQACSVPWVDA